GQVDCLAASHTTPTRYLYLGSGKVWAVRFSKLFAPEAGKPSISYCVYLRHSSRTTFSSHCIKGRTTHSNYFDSVFALHGGNCVTCINGALESISRFNSTDFRDHAHIK